MWTSWWMRFSRCSVGLVRVSMLAGKYTDCIFFNDALGSNSRWTSSNIHGMCTQISRRSDVLVFLQAFLCLLEFAGGCQLLHSHYRLLYLVVMSNLLNFYAGQLGWRWVCYGVGGALWSVSGQLTRDYRRSEAGFDSTPIHIGCLFLWLWVMSYRKTSSMSRTKYQSLNVSCILLQLSSLSPLKPCVKLRMKM